MYNKNEFRKLSLWFANLEKKTGSVMQLKVSRVESARFSI